MKSLSQNYTESHGNTHETMADLIFCALVVLVLFVLALTVEVSQRVRGAVPKVTEVKAEDLVKLTPAEMEALSAKLKDQQQELETLRAEAIKNRQEVSDKLAALSGEQRFTGAREPAAFSIAYDYKKKLYYFVPSKDVNDADRARSGESILEHRKRQLETLVQVALAARTQRGFTLVEMNEILTSVTKYRSIKPSASGYSMEDEAAGIYYHILLSEYIAGETDASSSISDLIELAINQLERGNKPNAEMYPRCGLTVDVKSKTVAIGDVKLSTRDLRDLLLSVSGRGLLLDMSGYQGAVPRWLNEESLIPAGYIGKTPKE